MRDQRPTQHELHVEVQRVAANSPAKGILCLLAWYTRVGSHLTVDQIARSVLVPPGPVEELLCHLELNGHIAQHSASGATTYSALPDALEHYLRWGHADRAATPTPVARLDAYEPIEGKSSAIVQTVVAVEPWAA